MNTDVQTSKGFRAKIPLLLEVGRYVVRTLDSEEELLQACALRYQVFQVEMLGFAPGDGVDQDEFDAGADHLGIFDSKTQMLVATCRLNCSLFVNRFYSEQEFTCQELLKAEDVKVELGRVCVHSDYRKGIIIMLIWRALAAYMTKTNARYLFGCGSVMTESSVEADLLFRYLKEENKVRWTGQIQPTKNFRSEEFDHLLSQPVRPLTESEKTLAKSLLPALCQSYFDIGCYTPSPPAFDRDFKCIDFLTILDLQELSPQVRQKMFGNS